MWSQPTSPPPRQRICHIAGDMCTWGTSLGRAGIVPREHVPYLSASAVVIHYEEALYQVYGPLPLESFLTTKRHDHKM